MPFACYPRLALDSWTRWPSEKPTAPEMKSKETQNLSHIPTLSPAVQLRDSWLSSTSATTVSGFPTTDHYRPWAILCLLFLASCKLRLAPSGDRASTQREIAMAPRSSPSTRSTSTNRVQTCQGETHSSKFCRHPRRPDQVPCQVPALSGICSR